MESVVTGSWDQPAVGFGNWKMLLHYKDEDNILALAIRSDGKYVVTGSKTTQQIGI